MLNFVFQDLREILTGRSCGSQLLESPSAMQKLRLMGDGRPQRTKTPTPSLPLEGAAAFRRPHQSDQPAWSYFNEQIQEILISNAFAAEITRRVILWECTRQTTVKAFEFAHVLLIHVLFYINSTENFIVIISTRRLHNHPSPIWSLI